MKPVHTTEAEYVTARSHRSSCDRMLSARGAFVSTVCILLSAFSVGAATEENWGQWRGPLGTGEGPKADPPTKWSATENIKWKVKIPGRGTGTPVIWGDQIFIQTAIPTGKKVAEYPSEVPGSILAAQQEQPERQRPQGQEGQGRRRGAGGGGGGFGRGDKPS